MSDETAPRGAPTFSHLAKLRPTGTAEFAFDEVPNPDERPVLTVVCSADNPKYLAAIKDKREQIERQALAIETKNRKPGDKKRRNRGQSMIFELMRGVDREVYPETVIVGWRTVLNDKREEVPFSAENCREFLGSIPDYLMDALRAFAMEASNFTENYNAKDTEAIAGN